MKRIFIGLPFLVLVTFSHAMDEKTKFKIAAAIAQFNKPACRKKSTEYVSVRADILNHMILANRQDRFFQVDYNNIRYVLIKNEKFQILNTWTLATEFVSDR